MLSEFMEYVEKEARCILESVSKVPVYEPERFTKESASLEQSGYSLFTGLYQNT